MRVHRGIPEIAHRHFAKTLEAADFDRAAPGEPALHQLFLVRVVARVDRLGALGQPIERRDRQKEMALLDQLGRQPVEEGDQQRGDMGAVDVGVGHDDDLVVAQVA